MKFFLYLSLPTLKILGRFHGCLAAFPKAALFFKKAQCPEGHWAWTFWTAGSGMLLLFDKAF